MVEKSSLIVTLCVYVKVLAVLAFVLSLVPVVEVPNTSIMNAGFFAHAIGYFSLSIGYSGLFYLKSKKRPFLKAAAISGSIGILIEFLQLLAPYRTFDLVDMSVNVIFSILGAFMLWLILPKQ